MSVHPVFGIAQNLQDFCFSWALWRGVHVLPPAGRGETHSDCPAGSHLSCTRLVLDWSCLFWGCKATYTVDNRGSADWCGYKSLSSEGTSNSRGIDRRNVSLIFSSTYGKVGKTKKKRKEQCSLPQNACRFIYKDLIAVSCDTLVSWGTWVKKEPRQFWQWGRKN